MIPVAEPSLGEEEKNNLLEAIESGWISSKGKFIEEFENSFAQYCNVSYGIATSNGTTALQLALKALGVGRGCEVIVPSLTFVATANAVTYTGAKPVFADAHPDYWCVNPEEIEAKVTEKTKAVISVHLYGHPCDMDAIMDVAQDRGLFVIEDAAEAHGAQYKKKKVGGFGDVNCFSFYGNKIITTGEGGMCLTDDESLYEKMKILRDHGTNPRKHYWHDVLGFNFRMTNMQAAVGCAQVKKLDEFIVRKRGLAHRYNSNLAGVEGIATPPEMPWARSVYWMYSILVEKEFKVGRDELMLKLKENGVESRPMFNPVNTLPIYETADDCPVADELSKKGINLPSSVNLTEKDIDYITGVISSPA